MGDAEVPLLALNTVLFPGGFLPLHVGDPRHREMMTRCAEGDRTFGVVLIKAGPDISGVAVPYNIGTTAHIVQLNVLEGGAMNVFAIGQSRFRLNDCISDGDSLRADVTFIPDPPVSRAQLGDLTRAAESLFERYIGQVFMLAGRPAPRMDFDAPPDVFSFFVADKLQIALPEKQALLEAESVVERLNEEIRLLNREVTRLETILAAKAHLGPVQQEENPWQHLFSRN